MTVLDRVRRGELTAVTSALTLAEVLVVPLRNGDLALQSSYRNRLTSNAALTVVDVSRDILIGAATIRATTPGVKLPDAIHAATSLVAGCDVFVTNDARLAKVTGVNGVRITDLA